MEQSCRRPVVHEDNPMSDPFTKSERARIVSTLKARRFDSEKAYELYEKACRWESDAESTRFDPEYLPPTEGSSTMSSE